MENSIYNSMIAATQLLNKQTIIANNLANISTTGFKEKFNYILQNNSIKNLHNTYNKIAKEYYNLSPGTLNYTARNLDLFVKDNGWLSVKDINGQEAYTKNGHVKINSARKLTIQDNELIGYNCNITIPNNINVKILSDGVITSIERKKHEIFEKKIGQLKLVRLPIDDLIQKQNGLFYLKKGNELFHKNHNFIDHDNNVRIQSGVLETSNVNAAKNMIEMISNARQFEAQMKMISTCDKNYEYANQLINVNN
ncbi:MAG: flagellar basal-body rod protein FlgF [Buchnera aphidicola (Brevicoryne brassicae)]|uniref:Flagellar basal-body rod protein FlgF n=1 Tax=Buchnera aphidicola (Brevicoryne brassicae) TaxID=911343 RepID=A0AAJ5TX45_9GAMM|nr:flagellar basal-body rod protein FlgF [Buchnera aphidicola]QCI19901.1 flagellar basal-body rod protein FlgF [Buchnera aphidicola (Brevicoryne brassicae)]WAI18724.1 MAG: flagellar basal-body rod protein FlgF [Buchnera aphidicola (Brevicoryne brassicae)]